MNSIKAALNYIFRCPFKGHYPPSNIVHQLYEHKDYKNPIRLHTICTQCYFPIIIYKFTQDWYEVIEDL